MQTKFWISILLLMVSVTGFSQSTNQLPPSPGFVKKGIITLNDGTPNYFNHLQFRNDTVFYQDFEMNSMKVPLPEINQITKESSYLGIGVLAGGGFGLLFGLVMAKTLDRTGDFVAIISTWGEEQSLDTRKEQTSILIFSTLVGTGLGAGIGALFPKNKIIFSNSNQSISFAPVVTMNPQLKPELGVTFRINFR